MVQVSILYNAFSDRFSGFEVKGKARAPRTESAYNLARATYNAIHDKFNSAKIEIDEPERVKVWDIRENKQAQAACWVLQKGMEQLAKDYPSEVSLSIVDKFDI